MNPEPSPDFSAAGLPQAVGGQGKEVTVSIPAGRRQRHWEAIHRPKAAQWVGGGALEVEPGYHRPFWL